MARAPQVATSACAVPSTSPMALCAEGSRGALAEKRDREIARVAGAAFEQRVRDELAADQPFEEEDQGLQDAPAQSARRTGARSAARGRPHLFPTTSLPSSPAIARAPPAFRGLLHSIRATLQDTVDTESQIEDSLLVER